jgi:hypothetical protein
MEQENYQAEGDINNRYKILFFAGGETRDDKFNTFTGAFIGLMKKILGTDFDFIKGVYYKYPIMNVYRALNLAQNPVENPENEKFILIAFRQIIDACRNPETQLVIISSSSGSVIAAQTACYMVKMNINTYYFKKPFHLVLGASMISPQSNLYKQLINYREEGKIGIILNDEMQDEGDTSFGVGGATRMEAYRNALGLMFPFFSRKYNGPSFLNTNPERGHIHRRRSQTVLKAIDYVKKILIEHKLAGNLYKEKASSVLLNEFL